MEAYTFSFESRLPEQLGSESEEAAARLFDNRDDLYHGVIPVPSESCYILRDTVKRMAVLLQDDPSIQKEAVDSFVSLLATADALRESFLSQANRHVSLRTKVLDYLQQHLFEPLTIDDVCKHFGFNRLYITNLFRKWTGQGIREYLVDERIQAAKRLLSSTSQPVDDIAKKCGSLPPAISPANFTFGRGVPPHSIEPIVMKVSPSVYTRRIIPLGCNGMLKTWWKVLITRCTISLPYDNLSVFLPDYPLLPAEPQRKGLL